MEASFRAEAEREAELNADSEQQAETGASPSDDQIVEKKEDGAIQMQNQEEQPNDMQVAIVDQDQ